MTAADDIDDTHQFADPERNTAQNDDLLNSRPILQSKTNGLNLEWAVATSVPIEDEVCQLRHRTFPLDKGLDSDVAKDETLGISQG